MISLETFFTNKLPADPEVKNFRRQVPASCYSFVQPKPVRNPKLIAYSQNLAEELGFEKAFCSSSDFSEYFSGNKIADASQPYSMCYGGHQFGNWAGQLGDGRAINLGELVDANGIRQSLQLKGAGPTPYSRSADGLAVLRSSVREFLCSEAMHFLGVPSTRALSLVETGEKVLRDMFYDGRPEYEPGAVVCRVAPSFIRFGNFEIHAARNEVDILRRLADFTIDNYFPGIQSTGTQKYIDWFLAIVESTCDLIVNWMRVGFVHGVMNTDNMSIHGLTIDYGPYGWLDNYDPGWTPNTTDAEGRRYCFGNQPAIAQWNLLQLANALFPLVQQVEPLQDAVEYFSQCYRERWLSMMRKKLGLDGADNGDKKLINQLLNLLHHHEVDFTLFFRQLAKVEDELMNDYSVLDQFECCFYSWQNINSDSRIAWQDWFALYSQRILQSNNDNTQRVAMMNANNPWFILRNYLAQEAIEKAEAGDYSQIQTLLKVLEKPYLPQSGAEKLAAKRPGWAKQKPGCSMLSCSS